MKKRIAVIFVLAVLICTLITSVYAYEAIQPRYNNTFTTSTNFSISSTGKATISASYDAYQEYFSNAKITSYIEKRTLGIFWTKVDIGQANNEWVDTLNNYMGAIVHEFNLTNTGTYRATVVYEISGTGGATDVIDYEQERTYS